MTFTRTKTRRIANIFLMTLLGLALVACDGAEFSPNDKVKNKSKKSSDDLISDQSNPGGNDVVIDTKGNVVDMSDKTIDNEGNILDSQGKILGQVDSINGKNWTEKLGGKVGEAGRIGGGTDRTDFLVERKLTQKNTYQKRTDIFWTLDTSFSMSNELKEVSENISPMIDRLQKETDTRIGLMTFVSNGEPRQVPRSHLGIPQHLRFEVSPALQADLFQLEHQLVLSKDSLSRFTDFLNGIGSNFYRNDSAKFLIVVTDDDSDMSAENFLSKVGAKLDLSDFKVFGFVGTATSNCNIAKRGKVYESLAQSTGGKIFDICEEDWAKHFEDLTTNIITTVTSNFEVSREIKSIADITVDGVNIDAKDYNFSGNKITINEALIKDVGLEIEIHYTPKD